MFKNIVEFKNFQLNRKINSKKLYRILSSLKHQNNNNLLKSLSKSYNYSFKKKNIK